MKNKLIIFLSVIIVILSLVLLYSKFITSHKIKVKEYAIIDKTLPLSFHGLKVVHFSDVMYGKTIAIKDIKKIVKKINELNPDIVVFTGDFFTKNIKVTSKEKDELKSILSSINVKYEKYAILGDNDLTFKDDFYYVFSDSFIILDNESRLIFKDTNTPIKITGINEFEKEEITKEEEKGLFNILLLHKPDEIEKSKNIYSIALAGHSMGGQINIPLYGPLIKLNGAKKYITGKYELKDTTLFVNEGIGSQNFNMRINNTPKINLYRIYSK